MSGDVTVSTGQPVTGWVAVGAVAISAARNHLVARLVLYNKDAASSAHMIIEAAEEVTNGVAAFSEIIEKNADIAADPLGQREYRLQNCIHRYLRLSASSDSPGFSPITVQGGIEVIQ